jgi:hypothetical protein
MCCRDRVILALKAAASSAGQDPHLRAALSDSTYTQQLRLVRIQAHAQREALNAQVNMLQRCCDLLARGHQLVLRTASGGGDSSSR